MPPSAQPSITSAGPSLPHEAWHYSLRFLGHGEWAVDREDGQAGGIFVTLQAALRFLRSDLEDMIVIHQEGGVS